MGVTGADETPDGDALSGAFDGLNDLIESWSVERLTIPFVQRATWTIVSTKGILGTPYTVGTGGDVNIVRPPLPNDLVIKYQDTGVSPTLEYRLAPLTDAAWEGIPQKNLTSPLPSASYYQPTYSGSLGALYLWMVPTQSGLQGVAYAPSSLAEYSLTTDNLIVPAGVRNALQKCLKLEISPMFDVEITPTMVSEAREAKAWLKSMNFRMVDLVSDPMFARPMYSIYTDGPA